MDSFNVIKYLIHGGLSYLLIKIIELASSTGNPIDEFSAIIIFGLMFLPLYMVPFIVKKEYDSWVGLYRKRIRSYNYYKELRRL